jgi:hypothetical protein
MCGHYRGNCNYLKVLEITNFYYYAVLLGQDLLFFSIVYILVFLKQKFIWFKERSCKPVLSVQPPLGFTEPSGFVQFLVRVQPEVEQKSVNT